jgi:hypothetical protein
MKKPAAMRVLWTSSDVAGLLYGGLGRNRTGVRGFAGRYMTTLPPGRWALLYWRRVRGVFACASSWRARRTLKKTKPRRTEVSSAIWSGKRDSNSRPRPWQGRALPTELFPRGTRILRFDSQVSIPNVRESDFFSIECVLRAAWINVVGAKPAKRRVHTAGRTRSSEWTQSPANFRRCRTDAGSAGRVGTAARRSR